MDEIERDRKILAKYPTHILLLVKAAKKLLGEGHAHIKDGLLIVPPPDPDLRSPQGKESKRRKDAADPRSDQK